MRINTWHKLHDALDMVYNLEDQCDEDWECNDFICPHCGEPILEDDWMLEDVRYRCPICEELWDIDFDDE